MHKPAYSQPMCTALQIALVDLLLSWGLFPARVIGHSSGEIAAAFCAGAISKTSALKIAFFRGRLAARLAEACGSRGSMMAVGLSQDSIEPYLSAHGHHEEHGATDVVVACVNSPKNITVSGREEHIDALEIILNRDGVFTRKLHLGVAYHSKAMDEIAVEYQTLISDIRTGQPISDSLIMFSSVTGKGTSNDETRKCEYWVENMTSQVKFSEALTNLCSLSSRSVPKKLGGHKDTVIINDLLEIGPHSALRGPIWEILEAHADSQSITYGSILNRNVCAATSILSALGRLHCLGYAIDTSALNGSNKGYSNLQLLSDLPEYPFNHDQSYSMESRLSKNFRTRNIPRHELLGTPASDWNPQEARWRHIIRASELPWITDHKVGLCQDRLNVSTD